MLKLRSYSTLLKPSSKSKEVLVYVSKSNSPWFNLAFEDWLFKSSSKSSYVLFLYRNSPSVIIGRNQNPWKEMNLKAMKELNIPFVRRRSGGGTVFHDLGNTNYSVIMPQSVFNRRDNAQMVANALNELSVPATVNDRNDIVIDSFKISGSAFKLTSSRAYHHGTMLLNSHIETLSKALKNSNHNMVTKGVASVRSPVNNVIQWKNDISHDEFVQAVIRKFVENHNPNNQIVVSEIDESILKEEGGNEVESLKNELKDWNWRYGQTPEFTNTFSDRIQGVDITAKIKSKHGKIVDLKINNCDVGFVNQFIDKRYGFISSDDIKKQNTFENDIVQWLIKRM